MFFLYIWKKYVKTDRLPSHISRTSFAAIPQTTPWYHRFLLLRLASGCQSHARALFRYPRQRIPLPRMPADDHPKSQCTDIIIAPTELVKRHNLIENSYFICKCKKFFVNLLIILCAMPNSGCWNQRQLRTRTDVLTLYKGLHQFGGVDRKDTEKISGVKIDLEVVNAE